MGPRQGRHRRQPAARRLHAADGRARHPVRGGRGRRAAPAVPERRGARAPGAAGDRPALRRAAQGGHPPRGHGGGAAPGRRRAGGRARRLGVRRGRGRPARGRPRRRQGRVPADPRPDPARRAGQARPRPGRAEPAGPLLDAERVLAAAGEPDAKVQDQIDASDVEMVSGRIDAAFDRLLGAVRRSAGADRDAARRHLLSLFELLPSDDPRVGKARRSLQSALF
ncbi:tetratricopeptide repeat protein [Actinomadura yumaensis]|uniref:tetratricopeptide repeat protein n=1 Tax=Actinomadura yumaensis TaxID=111807 RepID=UPI003617888D